MSAKRCQAEGVLSLLTLFVALPAFELYLLLVVGTRIGPLETFSLIVFTGVLGAALVRRQGLGVFHQIQRETLEGRVPALSMLEGVILLVAGALLVTPGLLTDSVGFLALVPPLRRLMAQQMADRVVVLGSSAPTATFVGFSPPGAPQSRPGGNDGIIDLDTENKSPKR